VNQREREILARIYTVANDLASLPPSNPADIKRHVQASNAVRDVGRSLAFAISSLGFGDLPEARYELDDAESKLEQFRSR
jgi:hypothetical protein